MILTILGYLILLLLAWVVCHLFIFTAARAWHTGKAQAERQVTEEIRQWDDSLYSTEILRRLNEIGHKDKRILDVTETLLNVTSEMNRTVGHLLKLETERMGGFGDDPPAGPTLVS